MSNERKLNMSEEYEIIFITEEGRAIKNNKTGEIYHSEFEIIDEKNKQIKDLQQKVEQLEKENKQLKDNWNKLKEYCQNNSFMQNTREYGTLTVVDADELAIYMEELENGDSNE